MLKIFYTSSEKNKKFGVYKVIEILRRKLKNKQNNIKYSNKISDLIRHNPDLVHVHGCWKLHLFIIFLISKILKIKIVMSPHGMLDPISISQKKIKKKLGWFFYQKFVLLYSDLIIVNSNNEKKNIKLITKKKNINIKVINHGVEISENFSLKTKKNKNLSFIFYSRIHPSKNLLNLLEIWTKNPFFKNYKLDIYGEIVDMKYYLIAKKIIKYHKNIKFKGKINTNIQKLISNYNVFVHPSLSENFGLVILEALSAGTFIILNKNLDWKIIEKKGFGMLIKFDYKNLKKAIEIIEKKKEKINNINFRKKQLNFVKKKYNWNYIAQEYLSEYF